VGLVGYGAVAKILQPILDALGARVLFWSRSRKNTELNDLLSQSDIVSLHLPLTPETAGIVDPRKMKRGAILVNTARGGLVVEKFLTECLVTRHLAAAGLDVFANEPPDRGSPLMALPNVVCTPHVAWLTRETLERSVEVARENVRRLKSGNPLLHRVA
jgi:phosphoglycerate dehydrogenase-like enzyme